MSSIWDPVPVFASYTLGQSVSGRVRGDGYTVEGSLDTGVYTSVSVL